jgi:hypothetical protein
LHVLVSANETNAYRFLEQVPGTHQCRGVAHDLANISDAGNIAFYSTFLLLLLSIGFSVLKPQVAFLSLEIFLCAMIMGAQTQRSVDTSVTLISTSSSAPISSSSSSSSRSSLSSSNNLLQNINAAGSSVSQLGSLECFTFAFER